MCLGFVQRAPCQRKLTSSALPQEPLNTSTCFMKRGRLSETYFQQHRKPEEQSPLSQAGGSYSFSRVTNEELKAQSVWPESHGHVSHCPLLSPLHLPRGQQTSHWSPASGSIVSARDVLLKEGTDFMTFPANASSVSPAVFKPNQFSRLSMRHPGLRS